MFSVMVVFGCNGFSQEASPCFHFHFFLLLRAASNNYDRWMLKCSLPRLECFEASILRCCLPPSPTPPFSLHVIRLHTHTMQPRDTPRLLSYMRHVDTALLVVTNFLTNQCYLKTCYMAVVRFPAATGEGICGNGLSFGMWNAPIGLLGVV